MNGDSRAPGPPSSEGRPRPDSTVDRKRTTAGSDPCGGARRSRAFTLVELVIVLFLLGTVALLAAPSLHGTLEEYEADRAAGEVTGLLRYARSLSATGTEHAVLFDPAAGRVTVWNTDAAAAAPDPLRKTRDCVLELGTGRFPNTSLASADFSGETKVAFDRLGNPERSGTVVLRTGSRIRTLRIYDPGGRVEVQ